MSNGLSVQEKKRKTDFQDGCHRFSRSLPSWISDRKILAIFDLQVILMLLTKFQVNWLWGLGEEAENWFCHGGHLGFTIDTILTIFDLKVTPMLPTSFESNGLSFQKTRKIDFQDGCTAAILDFRSARFSYFFYLQVIPKLYSKFGVNWPFCSGAEAKNRFSKWLPWRHFGFPIGTILAILIYKSPQCFLPSLESIGFWV